ncbi:MAG TPA: beta-N-acetylhexosaminidase [Vicinamibacterales bacterium]
MSLRDIRAHAGQLLISGFDGFTIPPEMRAIAREFDLGGLILFSRNVEAPEQVAEIAIEAQDLRKEVPLWVSVDQEGGRVQRLREPFTRWPPMVTLGRAGDETLARRFAAALAAELKAVGITLDFAPVLDVLTNAKNPAIGDRALSDKPEEVARLGRVLIETIQGAGVAAAGKHFPGHGDTGVDSHEDLPVCDLPPDRIRAVEFVPFRTAIEANVAFMLTCHVLFPAFDEEYPATLSPRIVQALLKDELGFSGAVLTDDLDMKAIADRYTIEDAVVRALRAGCDGLLICGGDYDRKVRALEAIIRAAEEDRAFERRVEDAFRRMRAPKERFLIDLRRPARPQELRASLGTMEHQMVAEEMRQWL